jgi:hypothetical protein
MLNFSPSHAGRWVLCGGSVELSQPYFRQKTERSEAELEGIAAHWVAEELFAGREVPIGDATPNGVTVTEEMLDAAREYISVVPSNAVLEYPINLDGISPGMKGYVDASRYEPSSNILDIWDFKYGHGLVDEFENWQMLVEVSAFGNYLNPTTKIRLHVVQPRCYQAESHRTWELSGAEYAQMYLPKIKEAAKAVGDGTAKTTTGKQCKNCAAAGSCLALALAAYDVIDRTTDSVSTELSPEELARELQALHTAQERLKARLIGLEETASASIQKGGRVPGYTLTPQMGNLEWTSNPEAVIAMAKMNGVDVRKPTATITPTQAKKAGMSEALVESLSTRPSKAPKLTKVNPNQAKKVFKK